MSLFVGRNALVTGAARGIGRATALRLARAGANVLVNYLSSEESAQEVVRAIRDCGTEAAAIRADVRDLDQVREMADQARQQLGDIDILVNNAGVVRDNLVTFMKDDEWQDVLDTSLKGAFHCIKVIGREMVRRKAGRIINVSSDAGLMGDMMRANYAAAKAGLLGLTRTVAREFARSGVNVNAVAPGIIETDMISGMSESKRATQLGMIPQGRFGRPEEVAEVILFLASDQADYITGQVLCIDGGLRM